MKKFNAGGGVQAWTTPSGKFGFGAGPVSPIANVAAQGATAGAQGIGSLFANSINPLSLALSAQQLYKGYSGRKKAERQKQENLRLLALDAMAERGIDPFAIYDVGKVESTIDPVEQEALNLAQQEMDILNPPQPVAEGYAAEQIIKRFREENPDVMAEVYNDFLASGLDYDDYKKRATATTSEVAKDVSGTPDPRQYVDITGTDPAGIPGDLIEGTYTDPDGTMWAYDMLGRKWVISSPTTPSDPSGGGGGGGGGGAGAGADNAVLVGSIVGGKDFNYEDYKANPDL